MRNYEKTIAELVLETFNQVLVDLAPTPFLSIDQLPDFVDLKMLDKIHSKTITEAQFQEIINLIHQNIDKILYSQFESAKGDILWATLNALTALKTKLSLVIPVAPPAETELKVSALPSAEPVAATGFNIRNLATEVFLLSMRNCIPEFLNFFAEAVAVPDEGFFRNSRQWRRCSLRSGH